MWSVVTEKQGRPKMLESVARVGNLSCEVTQNEKTIFMRIIYMLSRVEYVRHIPKVLIWTKGLGRQISRSATGSSPEVLSKLLVKDEIIKNKTSRMPLANRKPVSNL